MPSEKNHRVIACIGKLGKNIYFREEFPNFTFDGVLFKFMQNQNFSASFGHSIELSVTSFSAGLSGTWVFVIYFC